METNTYNILNEKREDVEKKLRRLEKKAQRYGIPYSYSFGEVYPITIKHKNDYGVVVENIYELVDLTIESETIQKDGYTPVAYIEHADNGNIVRVFNGEMKKEWAHLKPFCEHCNSNHNLKYTFIVKNGDEEKQVGKTCLKDYCGIDPQMVGIFNQFYDEIEEYTPEGYDFSDPIPCGYDTTLVLAFAIQVLREQGYVKSEERDSNKAMIHKYVAKNLRPSEEDWNKAVELEKAIDAMSIDEAVDARLDNVRTRIKCLYCKPSEFGYFAYAPLAYEKHIKRIEKQNQCKAEQNEMGAKSDYVGTIGERTTFDVKEYKLITSWETQYGTTFLYRFIDKNDNVLVWFASSCLGKWENSEWKEPVIEHIKATVKDHSERDGVKQTIITRVKVA